jgi:HEAT repeat protein
MPMSQLIWSLDDLQELTKSDDADVRFWAVDRLVRHFPGECCDAIAEFLLDEHDATPGVVARHLGEHGQARHHAILIRGFRLLRGLTPGYCLQALIRLGHPNSVGLARDALKRGDLTEPALAIIVASLAELRQPEAREVVRELIEFRLELLTEPAALRGELEIVQADELPDLIGKFLRAMQWRSSHRAGEAFRAMMDALRIDDASWCFRTGPSGHIELRKTIKAVESGYDCDIITAMGEATVKQIAQRFRARHFADVVRSLADWTCSATTRLPEDPQSDLPQRIAAAVRAFSAQSALDDAARLGHQFEQWLLGFQLSAAFAVARGHDPQLELRLARGDLNKLLRLAELETAHLLNELPMAIAAVCREDGERARQAQDWCLRMLESQGPFFPKVTALEILGDLRAVHFIPEVMDYLTDENSYVYGAAERALSKMGQAIIAPAIDRIDSDSLDPDAAHSLLVLFCDLGTQAALEAVMQHLDWFMDAVGPGATAEWVSLFGVEEFIEPLRDWLDSDPAMIGQALLLLGALHQVAIPEEEEILQAIEDERARQNAEETETEGSADGSDPQGGNYLM